MWKDRVKKRKEKKGQYSSTPQSFTIEARLRTWHTLPCPSLHITRWLQILVASASKPGV